jgi:hypothetical protein
LNETTPTRLGLPYASDRSVQKRKLACRTLYKMKSKLLQNLVLWVWSMRYMYYNTIVSSINIIASQMTNNKTRRLPSSRTRYLCHLIDRYQYFGRTCCFQLRTELLYKATQWYILQDSKYSNCIASRIIGNVEKLIRWTRKF